MQQIFFHLFMRLCSLLLTAIFASQLNKHIHTKNNKIMRGKYINANIMMAALAGKRSRRINGNVINVVKTVAETPASFADYQIIWRKEAKPAEKKLLYRSITACIY